jgi:hypothetical protein
VVVSIQSCLDLRRYIVGKRRLAVIKVAPRVACPLLHYASAKAPVVMESLVVHGGRH